MPYSGQVATTGNFVSPLSPHETPAAAVFKFSLYHLVDLVPGEEATLFPVSVHIIGGETARRDGRRRFMEQSAIEKGQAEPQAPLSKSTLKWLKTIIVLTRRKL